MFEKAREPTVTALRKWICQEAAFQMIAAEAVRGISGVKTLSSPGQPSIGGKRQHSFNRSNPKVGKDCEACHGTHGIWNCAKFQNLDINEQWKLESKLGFVFAVWARATPATSVLVHDSAAYQPLLRAAINSYAEGQRPT